MAKQRIRIGLNEKGLGQVWLGNTDVSEFVREIRFEATAGRGCTVGLLLSAELDVKADADVLATIEPLRDRPAATLEVTPVIPTEPNED
jgi:hypothetical protein